MSTTQKYITVFVPTYNGGNYIRPLIDAVLAQELPSEHKLELMITDSGSKDDSVETILSYGDKINFKQIPNEEYGHGKTRQQAAKEAKGDYILFLSQDATPASDRWLINMIEPFFVSEKVGCVFGRQIPRPFAVPTIKREVAGVFGALGAPDSIVLHRYRSLVDAYHTNDLNSFFSDVNSAIRKDLVNTVPFRDLAYAEDQALAEDMQNAGYLKAYSPSGAVWHSNEYSPKEYYHRKFDEYAGLIESVNYVLLPSKKSLFLGWIKPTLKDWSFNRKDGEYNLRAKIKFFALSPFYNYYLELGKYHAAKYTKNIEKRAKISLESRRK